VIEAMEGQITIFEYLEEKNRICNYAQPQTVVEVDIRGLCDDAYCPKCGYSFKEWLGEVDINCPECHTKLDWTFWHRLNDKEG